MNHRIVLFFSLFFSGLSFADLPINVIGKSVIESGIFTKGCPYDTSASDHGPVIYTRDDISKSNLTPIKIGNIATWNIASPISHYFIEISGEDGNSEKHKFLNHKFYTDEDGNLISRPKNGDFCSRSGEKLGFMGTSEVVLLKKWNPESQESRGYAAVTDVYVKRLGRIVDGIKKMFKDQNLDYMLLQEVPHFWQTTRGGENIQKVFRDLFKPTSKDEKQDLFITFSLGIKGMKGNPPDTALVAKSSAPRLTALEGDYVHRLQPYCNTKTKEFCLVAAHVKFAANDEELRERCTGIGNLVISLKNKGYKRISILGDFNISADRIAKVCQNIDGFKDAELNTTSSGNSCSNNSGNVSEKNIDLDIEF